MTAAHEKDDHETFSTAEKELRDLDVKLDRQRKIDAADRAEQGRVINGDAKLDSEIRSKFSLTRAVAAAAGLAVDAGFEREVQGELSKRAGRPAEGIYIPTEIFEKRVQVSSSDPAGGYLVGTDHRPDLYINALTAASVVRGLGARDLTALSGYVEIPMETGNPTIGWVGDNSALTPSDASFGKITLSPHHAGALAEWSRNMLLQSSPGIEALLRQMLARDLALAIDRAAINGDGILEPLGVLNTSAIQSTAYTTDIFTTTAVAMGKADTENVGARRSFLTTNAVREICLKELDADKLPVPVSAIFHDEPVTFSNQVPKTLGAGSEHGLIYGDWSELLIGVWSEIDLLVNPFESTAYSKGNVSIRAMATVDCAVRHPKAFVKVTGVTTSAVAIA
ncbi:phage major capsid protein [Aestuariivirga sp.]|uniref:phage major capsid protein n=1 Tax=Aestuariivirga sp. TaxID=2650926 RepID=UPI0035AE9346